MALRHSSPYLLISIGTMGIAGYQLILRIFHPPIMAHDLFHGIWFGICLGLEILGLIYLRKANRSPSAAR